MTKDIHDYRDIMNIERPEFNRYPKMSMAKRAGQFAPFAALTGHKEAVDEVARRTDEKIILDENAKSLLDYELQRIGSILETRPQVSLTYFVEDLKKDGGAYKDYQGRLVKIDHINRTLVFEDGARIGVEDLYRLELV